MTTVRHSRMWLVICLCGAVIAGQATARVIYVEPSDAAEPGNGSESSPYKSIQGAIDAAESGDKIVARPGTYFEAINFSGKGITLVSSGGQLVTILDGTGHNHVVQCIGGEGPDTVFDGFTITGGDANGVDPLTGRGGGMLNKGSRPTIANCTFRGNTAPQGGGMCNEAAAPTVVNCTFDRNAAQFGAGMYNKNSNPAVIDCTFSGNKARQRVGGNRGGGMLNLNSDPNVTGCRFNGNAAHYGGAVYNYRSSPMLAKCVFGPNTAVQFGGVMCSVVDSEPTVVECTFGSYEAQSGDGIFNDIRSHLKVIASVVHRNQSGEW